jgi:hypothetical protein
MNGYLGNNSIYTNIELSKDSFLDFYKEEINELYNNIVHQLNKRNIKIESYDVLYYDFLDYIYKYSIRKRPIL